MVGGRVLQCKKIEKLASVDRTEVALRQLSKKTCHSTELKLTLYITMETELKHHHVSHRDNEGDMLPWEMW